MSFTLEKKSGYISQYTCKNNKVNSTVMVVLNINYTFFCLLLQVSYNRSDRLIEHLWMDLINNRRLSL